MSYQLYYSSGACSMAVHIVLEELGVPTRLMPLRIHYGDTSKPDYLAINPKGRVPALAIPGEAGVLTELPAILTFLAESHDTPALLPPTALQRGRAQEWLAWLAGWMHGTGYGLIWRPHRFSADPDDAPALREQGLKVVAQANQDVTERLAQPGPWALGDQYSVVDPFLLVLFRWGSLVGLDMSEHTAWIEHTRCMLQRPAVNRVLEREEVTIPL